MVVHEVPPERIQGVSLTLIAGFLGAGKTTLLNHIISTYEGEPIGVLVNDFGEIDVDAELVANADGETITLANGCICCTIRDDLVLTLFRLLHRDDPPKRVIVECSGVSDPAEIIRGFGDAEMFDIVQIDSVIAVADAEQLQTVQFHEEPLALHQLVTADLVVLSKVDLVEPDEANRAEARVRDTVPGARVLRAQRGRVPLELVLGTGGFDLERWLAEHEHEHEHEQEHEHAPAHGFETAAFLSERALDPGAVRRVLDALPVGVIRAKGILDVQGEDEREVVVHLVGKRIDVSPGRPWGERPRQSRFVAIGRKGSFDPEAIREQLRACEAPASSGATTRLASWIRRLWAGHGG